MRVRWLCQSSPTLCEERHQHVLEKFERTQHRGQPREFLVDADGVVLAQRGDERSRIERRPSRRVGPGQGNGTGRATEIAQFIVAEPGQPPDAVSLLDGAAEEPQARDIGVCVHPSTIITNRRDGAVTAFPSPQGVDADAGHPGYRPDRVAAPKSRGPCSSPHHPHDGGARGRGKRPPRHVGQRQRQTATAAGWSSL